MTPCQLCRGACCESIVLTLGLSDSERWLGLHGRPIAPGQVELATPCTQLCAGRCSIHASRPDHCRTYEVGGADCRATVLRRRPADAERIFAAMVTPPPLP
jgi:Fe-S-cluster containining protein